MRQPFPTMVGKVVALVTKPIEKTMEAGLPTNLAMRSSTSTVRSEVPLSERGLAMEMPYLRMVASAASAQGPSD